MQGQQGTQGVLTVTQEILLPWAFHNLTSFAECLVRCKSPACPCPELRAWGSVQAHEGLCPVFPSACQGIALSGEHSTEKISASQGLNTQCYRGVQSHLPLAVWAVLWLHIAGKGQGSSPACPWMTSSSISLGIALAPSGGGTWCEHQVPVPQHMERKRKMPPVCKGSWFEQVGLWMCRRFSALLWARCSSLCAPVLPSIGQDVGQGFEPCYCKAQLCFFPT